MELKDIQNLIKFVAKSGASEVKLEMEDVKITIRTGQGKSETTILQQAPLGVPQVPVPVPVAEPAATPAATPIFASKGWRVPSLTACLNALRLSHVLGSPNFGFGVT